MTPTGKARELGRDVGAALHALNIALFRDGFDPAACAETFHLGLGEFSAQLAGVSILRRLRQEAPRAALHLAPIAHMDVYAALARGDLLAAAVFTPPATKHPALRVERLNESEYVVAGAPGNPYLRKPLSRGAYCAAPHLAISVDGDRLEDVDYALARTGQSRRIVCTVNHLSIAPHVMARTDMLLTATRAYLSLFAPELEIAAWPLPVEIAPFVISFVSRPDIASAPAEKWFLDMARAELARAYAALL